MSVVFLSFSQRVSVWWSLSSKVGKDSCEDEPRHVADKLNPAEFSLFLLLNLPVRGEAKTYHPEMLPQETTGTYID